MREGIAANAEFEKFGRTEAHGTVGMGRSSLGEHRVRRAESGSTVSQENKSGCNWADVVGSVSRSRVVSKGCL